MGIFIKGGGGKGGGLESIVAGTGISVDITDPDNPIVSSTVTDTNDKAKVSSNDTTAGYLNGKLVAGSNITLTENNNGGNETLTIAAAAAPVTSVNTKTGAVTLTNTDVGAAATSHTHGAGDIISGTVATARLGSGTANSTTFLRGDQTWATAGGGVTGFTPTQNTAAPNDTVNASCLLVDAGTTNADAVVQAKGTGAILAQLPDNTTTGGDKRGTQAVDLQMNRSLSSQVASGARSGIIAGQRNQATGTNSGVFVGISNASTGTQSSILGGNGNSATSTNSVVVGGASNVSSSTHSAVLGGNLNTASAFGSGVLAGNNNTASGAYSLASGQYASATIELQRSHGNGTYSSIGACQEENHILTCTTTSTSNKDMTTDGGSPTSSNTIQLESDATYAFHILVVARRTDTDGNGAGWEFTGVIANDAGTISVIGTATKTELANNGSYNANLYTTSALGIQVAGATGHTVRWAATAKLIKIKG